MPAVRCFARFTSRSFAEKFEPGSAVVPAAGRFVALCGVVALPLLLQGCSHGTEAMGGAAAAIQGRVMGGQQPVTGATIQLYAAAKTGTGAASTALLTTVVTTSDGSGGANANANAGNGNNTMPAGSFTITGDYTCPSADAQVYLVATGGNPGLGSGTNNASLALMTALGSCGRLSPNTYVAINEVTTVGSVAALAPYMTSYSAVGSVSGAVASLSEAFSAATVYMDPAQGVAPGPSLPAGYYGSSTEVNTLADVLASCVNTAGANGNGSACDQLFQAAKPQGGTAPTETVGALLDVVNNPSNNVSGVWALSGSTPPFQPSLTAAPPDWTLPVGPYPITPVFSPAPGSFVVAPTVTLSSPVNGMSIFYTTDGSTPTSSSNQYTGPVSLAGTAVLKAIAVSPRAAGSSGVGGGTYTVTGVPAAPTFSLAPGIYGGPQTETLSTATGDATIYLTSDGTTPTAASTKYTGPIQVTNSATVKAIAVANGVSSAVSSATYVLNASGVIQTVAGLATSTGDGFAATAAVLRSPTSARFGPGRYLYVVGANRVRKIAPDTGIITAVAGTGTAGYSGDGGPATAAMLGNPNDIAVDASGNVYICDASTSRIRRVDAVTGNISTYAGSGTQGFSGDGGAATAAKLKIPQAIALDSSGNLYISDYGNDRIRRVDAATGNISTVSGTGSDAVSGDGGPASAAAIGGPAGLTFDSAGNLYFADEDNARIRRIAGDTGVISTVAGGGTLTAEGTLATAAKLSEPYSVSVDLSGNLYIADGNLNEVKKVAVTSGAMTTVAGTGTLGYSGDGGTATSAKLSNPVCAVLDLNGNVVICDQGNNRLRMVSAASGVISTVAGTGSTRDWGDGQVAANASFNTPSGMAVDASGNLYVTEQRATLRKISAASGQIATLAGTGTGGYGGDGGQAALAVLQNPYTPVLDAAGNIYFADSGNNRIRKIDASTGVISTYVGTGTSGWNGDGLAPTATQISVPHGLTIDGQGNLYFVDTGNNRVRKVAGGVVTTVAGSGTLGYGGDGQQATSASVKISQPMGLAVGSDGTIYIADSGSARVRKVNPAGVISTIAGTGVGGSSGDGGAATSATVSNPQGVALDTAGNLYVADTGNNRVRKITTGGVISTVAGTGSTADSGDGGAATAAGMYAPVAVGFDAAGNMYIAESYGNRIRVVHP